MAMLEVHNKELSNVNQCRYAEWHILTLDNVVQVSAQGKAFIILFFRKQNRKQNTENSGKTKKKGQIPDQGETMLLEKYSVLLPDTVVVVECRETEKKASNLFDLRL